MSVCLFFPLKYVQHAFFFSRMRATLYNFGGPCLPDDRCRIVALEKLLFCTKACSSSPPIGFNLICIPLPTGYSKMPIILNNLKKKKQHFIGVGQCRLAPHKMTPVVTVDDSPLRLSGSQKAGWLWLTALLRARGTDGERQQRQERVKLVNAARCCE